MYRIDSKNNDNGKFTDGNTTDPSKPSNGTVLNAHWLNAVQEELINVI